MTFKLEVHTGFDEGLTTNPDYRLCDLRNFREFKTYYTRTMKLSCYTNLT